jgi:hypothetical protein
MAYVGDRVYVAVNRAVHDVTDNSDILNALSFLFIVSLSVGAFSHRKPASAGRTFVGCCAQKHDDGDTELLNRRNTDSTYPIMTV